MLSIHIKVLNGNIGRRYARVRYKNNIMLTYHPCIEHINGYRGTDFTPLWRTIRPIRPPLAVISNLSSLLCWAKPTPHAYQMAIRWRYSTSTGTPGIYISNKCTFQSMSMTIKHIITIFKWIFKSKQGL